MLLVINTASRISIRFSEQIDLQYGASRSDYLSYAYCFLNLEICLSIY